MKKKKTQLDLYLLTTGDIKIKKKKDCGPPGELANALSESIISLCTDEWCVICPKLIREVKEFKIRKERWESEQDEVEV